MTMDDIGKLRKETPGRAGWGPFATVGLVLMVWFLMEATGIALYITTVLANLLAIDPQHARPEYNEFLIDVLRFTVPAQTFIIIPLLLYLVYFLARKAGAGPPLEYLGLRPVGVLRWIVWLLPVLAYQYLQEAAIAGLGREDVHSYQHAILNANPYWLVMLFAVVAAPVFEEVLIRGFMYRGLIGSRAGVAGTVLLTAFVWSLMHYAYGPLGVFFIFLLGIILGYARHRTGSVTTTIYCHMVFNLIAFNDIVSALIRFS